MAVLRNDARHDIFNRVAALDAPLSKHLPVANDHGNGFPGDAKYQVSAAPKIP
jgi:hypothetical protein